MSHSTANVTMQVPASMVEQLQEYMNALSMTQNATTQPTTQPTMRPEEIPRDDSEDTDEMEQAEVSKIHRHRIKEDGTWQFELSWKKSRAREWVNDHDCSCECHDGSGECHDGVLNVMMVVVNIMKVVGFGQGGELM